MVQVGRTKIRKRQLWGGLFAMMVAATIEGLAFAPKLTGTDDAVYLVSAQALATGLGFCKANLAGCPPEIYYPPGFPAFLSIWLPLLPPWPWNMPWLTMFPAVFAVLSLPVIEVLIFKLTGKDVWALLITVAVGVNYVLTWYTHILMTETLFILLSMAALLLLERREPSFYTVFMAGILIGLAMLVRTVGITLLGAALLYYLYRRHWRRAIILLSISSLLILPLFIRSFLIMRSPTWAPYRDSFIRSYVDTVMLKHWQDLTLGQAKIGDFVHRFITNITGHVMHSLPQLLAPTLLGKNLSKLLERWGLNWMIVVIFILLAVSAVAGFWLRIRERNHITEIYVALYLGMILLPGWYTTRNLLPVLPFIYLYIVLSLWSLGSLLEGRISNPRISFSTILPIIFLVLSISSNSLSQLRGNIPAGIQFRGLNQPYQENRPSFLEACEWVRINTDVDALVVYRSSEKMYLCSGRQAPPSLSTFPVSLNGRDHEKVIEAIYQQADYVLISKDDYKPPLTNSEPINFQTTYFLNPVVEKDKEHFLFLYETQTSPRVRIYRVLR